MTAPEFRNALATVGFTQRGFAAFVGANERTVRRWALDAQDIPNWVPVVLKLLPYAPRQVVAAGQTVCQQDKPGSPDAR